MKQEIIIFGTGEIAEMAKFYFDEDSDYKVVAFCADDTFIKDNSFQKLPLIPASQIAKELPPKKYSAHVALSYRKLNQIREEKYHLMKKQGYSLVSYVSTKSATWSDLSHGDNCFILENQTIQPKVKIGNNVMLWSGNHIGHGTQIKDHVYISSHVVISGFCTIGERSFLGVNAAVKDFTKIGSDNFITMGANVLADTGKGDVILDARGTVFEGGSEKAEKIKQTYFSL